jgi:predicted nucleotidyltransferase
MENDRNEIHRLDASARDAFVARLSEGLARAHDVRAAFLFGSFLEGGAFADVDVGVVFDEPYALLDVGRLSNQLWFACDRPAFELDVVPLNDAGVAFRREVAESGQALYERSPGEADDWAVQAISDAIDFTYAWELAAT